MAGGVSSSRSGVSSFPHVGIVGGKRDSAVVARACVATFIGEYVESNARDVFSVGVSSC